MSLLYLLPFLGIFTLAQSGSVVWSGNFDYYTDVSTFDLWSWSNEVGEYQWYIHGSNATSSYLATGSAYKNPADTWESVGLSLTIDVNAVWNNDGMERTELIPQSSVSLGTGQMYYHFSLYLDPNNLPDSTIEHQIFFFESHAVQLKYGVSPSPTNLVFLAGSTTYVIETTPGTWMNFAYDLDFTTGYAGLWYSTGSNDLVQVVAPVSAGVSTNSEDFHVGVLKLSVSGNPEVYYISGVYIESGTITTSVAGPGGSVSSSSTTSSSKSQTTTTTSSSKSQTTTTTSSSKSQTTTKSSTTTTKTTSTTTTTSGACTALYGQCGGIGWSGATCCSSGTCQELNSYYYQCLN